MKLVEFNKVKKSYSGNLALDELSFKILENSSVALVGNNGVGKSTAINILCNLIPYDSGDIFYKSNKIVPRYHEYKADLGIILSNPHFIEEFTPYEYLSFVCRFYRISKHERKARIQSILKFLEYDVTPKKSINKLSSGNRTKVSLAAALIHNPKMLVLDEPFVNLDMKTSEKTIKLFHAIKKNKTLFITSHHLDLVSDLCETFFIMDKGKIIGETDKGNYSDVNDLKEEIKRHLQENEVSQNLSWLY